MSQRGGRLTDVTVGSLFSSFRENGGLQGGSDEESGFSLQSFDFWLEGFDLAIPLGTEQYTEHSSKRQSELTSQAATFSFIDKQVVGLELQS
jgi:hypothetical protein